jgi:hypothetical protein
MARWSNSIKLTDYKAFREELEGQSGVYEIGYVRDGWFYEKYAGKAKCLWQRISSYNSDKCHNHDIRAKNLEAERKLLYFHYYRTNDYAGAESRMLHRHGVKEAGLYRFNGRLENFHFSEGYSRQAALQTVVASHCGNGCRKSCPRRPFE